MRAWAIWQLKPLGVKRLTEPVVPKDFDQINAGACAWAT
jgi:hypothetical protein